MKMPTYSNKQKKLIFEKINNLSALEHEEILKIIKINNVNYSKNKNGIFFNISTLDDNIVLSIDTFVTYCLSNKKELDEYDKIINECKLNNCLDGFAPSFNTSLGNMCKMQAEVSGKDAWSDLKVDDTVVEKFIKFADKVMVEKEKIGRKKLNLKFNNAKKRFSKKNERKTDGENMNDHLREEAYLLGL